MSTQLLKHGLNKENSFAKVLEEKEIHLQFLKANCSFVAIPVNSDATFVFVRICSAQVSFMQIINSVLFTL